MNLSTIVELSDVAGKPRARVMLPGPLRIGDRVRLTFRLRRENGGRTEVLDATGDWRISAMTFDAAGPFPKQHLSVESVLKTPTWKAIRKQSAWTRVLPPPRSPRTVLT